MSRGAIVEYTLNFFDKYGIGVAFGLLVFAIFGVYLADGLISPFKKFALTNKSRNGRILFVGSVLAMWLQGIITAVIVYSHLIALALMGFASNWVGGAESAAVQAANGVNRAMAVFAIHICGFIGCLILARILRVRSATKKK